MPDQPQQQPQQSSSGVVPPGPAPLLVGTWGGVETSVTRPAVPDDKVFWSDGFFPFGPGALRTLPDVSAAFFDQGSTTIYKIFCSFTSVYAFSTTGTITQVNLNSLVSHTVTNTFPGTTPANVGACQLLPGIVAFVTNTVPDGLFIYDELSQNIYAPGQVVPVLGGFTVPTGVKGQTCATYSGRLWIASTFFMFASAPDSFLDFTVANGAVSFEVTDSFLANQVTQLLSSGGFLYVVGDSSVNYISGVGVNTVLGTPVTTFTYQNADPEIGASNWPGAVISIGRNVGLANYSGYYVGSGGSFTKVSQPLDGVFSTANVTNLPTFFATAARVDIFGRRNLLLCADIVDPIQKIILTKLFLWDGKRWFPASQSPNIKMVTTWEYFGHCFAIASDTQKLYFLYRIQSTTLTKLVQSKLWVTPEGYHTVKTAGRFWLIAKYEDISSPNITVNIENETADNVVPSTATYTITGPGATGFFVAPAQAIGQMGVMLGMTISTNCTDMTLISAMIQPELISYRG
jgi:hypothetical protein